MTRKHDTPSNPEEPEISAVIQPAGVGPPPKVRKPFSKLAIELEPEDLSHKGVQKMMLAEVDRLEVELSVTRQHESNYHMKDKECAVLKARWRKHVAVEVLYAVAIAVSNLLGGWLLSGPKIEIAAMAGVTVAAAVLFLAAIIGKVFSERDDGFGENNES